MNGTSHWSVVWKQYKKSKTGCSALFVLILFFLIGLYAPLLASSKPLVVIWNHTLYFPLLRYLFFSGFYTKPIDLFFNLAMFTLPLGIVGIWALKPKRPVLFLLGIAIVHLAAYCWIWNQGLKNPARDLGLIEARNLASQKLTRYHEDPLLAPVEPFLGWSFDVNYLSDYAKINLLLNEKQQKAQHERLHTAREAFLLKNGREMPTLWHVKERHDTESAERFSQTLQDLEIPYRRATEQLPVLIAEYRPYSHAFIMAKYVLEKAASALEKVEAEGHLESVVKEAGAHRSALSAARTIISQYQKAQAELISLQERRLWLAKEAANFNILVPPLLRTFHWEEDAGGAQGANQYVPWWELTRVNRKDLVASLVFGIRVAIVVGVLAATVALLIGIPLGMSAGYFAGKTDLLICRLIEMWEAMPSFFMLLLVVAITQSKSIFLVIGVLGIFGWTGFARFMRSEVLKQRKLPYVDATRTLGFSHTRIMFSHILPNAIAPILTLLPFAIMGFITSEAGLSFLGLGEEGSSSWGVLMDEGRSVFPAESYLLWPPAILLTTLLIAIALVGDAWRDALDPKMRH